MEAAVTETLKPVRMARWIKVCRREDIPELGARVIRRQAGDIAIFRSAGGECFALLDRCPHKGGPLSQGIVFGRSVACPLHGWTVRLDDGNAVAPDLGCTAIFPVRVESGEIFLQV